MAPLPVGGGDDGRGSGTTGHLIIFLSPHFMDANDFLTLFIREFAMKDIFRIFAVLSLSVSSMVFAQEADFICKKLGSESSFNESYSKVDIKTAAGATLTTYQMTGAQELRFVATPRVAAGALGQNLKDGECSFKAAPVLAPFTSARFIVTSGDSFSSQTSKSSMGVMNVNVGFPTFGGLCCQTLMFKATQKVSGSVLVIEANANQFPVKLQ